MNGFKIALLILLAFGALSSVAQIGKPRRPLTPGIAVWCLILSGVYALLVVLA
jgi:hypothetical protein